jgi:hypothetical protein
MQMNLYRAVVGMYVDYLLRCGFNNKLRLHAVRLIIKLLIWLMQPIPKIK